MPRIEAGERRIETSEFDIKLFPIQMGKCPVIRGDGVMRVDVAQKDYRAPPIFLPIQMGGLQGRRSHELNESDEVP